MVEDITVLSPEAKTETLTEDDQPDILDEMVAEVMTPETPVETKVETTEETKVETKVETPEETPATLEDVQRESAGRLHELQTERGRRQEAELRSAEMKGIVETLRTRMPAAVKPATPEHEPDDIPTWGDFDRRIDEAVNQRITQHQTEQATQANEQRQNWIRAVEDSGVDMYPDFQEVIGRAEGKMSREEIGQLIMSKRTPGAAAKAVYDLATERATGKPAAPVVNKNTPTPVPTLPTNNRIPAAINPPVIPAAERELTETEIVRLMEMVLQEDDPARLAALHGQIQAREG